jgi:hypothetical protein
MKTYEIARRFKDEGRRDGGPWIVDDLRIWIAKNVTKESPWYLSSGPEPRFVRVARCVLRYYRRHGWIKRDRGCYEFLGGGVSG